MSVEGHVEGRLVSVNVGRPRTVSWQGRSVTTAIFKEPVTGPQEVVGVNVLGDDQADRRVHGGHWKALYAYSNEDYSWWTRQLQRELRPGTFGENMTVSGVDLTDAAIGERWLVGTAVLRVTEPRLPCVKLALRMDDPGFPKKFTAARRPGAYLAVETEGTVAAGDAIEIVDRTDGLTIGAVVDAYHGDRSLLTRMIDNPDLSPAWREWAQRASSRDA